MSLAILAVCTLHGQTSTTQTVVSDPPADEVRFAVAHQHAASWCYGYLYVTRDKIRYEVVQPQSSQSHSFEVPRSQVLARQWVLFGQPQDAIELKIKGATYHMRWLKNEAEVNTAGSKRMHPPDSAPPDTLIATIQSPGAAAAQGGAQPPNNNLSAGINQASPATFNGGTPPAAAPNDPGPGVPTYDDNASIPPGTLSGVYVALAGADARPGNKQFLFYPDGFMVYGVPQEGMLDFDFNHYRPENNKAKNWVGRYKLDGDTIKIVWQNQFGDPANPVVVKRNETSAHPVVDIGWEVFIPMCRCTGKRLSGKYRYGPTAANQFLQFFPDGTFFDQQATDQLVAPYNFGHPRIQRGTYSIQSQTLILNYADGHRGMVTFLAPKAQENQPTFDWIELGWHMLFEENYAARLAGQF